MAPCLGVALFTGSDLLLNLLGSTKMARIMAIMIRSSVILGKG
jgi:hypothetical protein